MKWRRIQERIDDGLHDRLKIADLFGTRMRRVEEAARREEQVARREEEAALRMNNAIVEGGRRILEQQVNDLEDAARAAPAAAAKLSEALEMLTEPKGHPAGALREQERALTQALALHAEVDITYHVEGLGATIENASRFRELEADVARARPYLEQDEQMVQSLASLGERLSAALAETEFQLHAYTRGQHEPRPEWQRPWMQNPHDWLVDSGPG
jgi:hypothetical protein